MLQTVFSLGIVCGYLRQSLVRKLVFMISHNFQAHSCVETLDMATISATEYPKGVQNALAISMDGSVEQCLSYLSDSHSER